MRRHRRTARLLVPIVAVLFAGEFAVRAVESRLPEQFLFQSAEADLKIAQMDQLASQGGVDVVVAGSSLVTYGLQPDILSDALGSTVYNAGLAASTPILLDRWMTDVVLTRLDPEVVVIGVSSYDLFDDGAAREFLAAFEESDGGEKATDSAGILDRADHWIGDVSALWRHKQALRDPTVWSNAILKGGQPRHAWIDDYNDDLGADGAVRPTEDRRFAGTDGGGPNVENWSLGADSPRALRRMLEEVLSQGATPILVGMPVTSEFIEGHPRGEQTYAEFRAALIGLAADLDVTVLDYQTQDIDYFADIVHLNRWGAAAFSQTLALDIQTVLSETSTSPPDLLDEGETGPQSGSGPNATVEAADSPTIPTPSHILPDLTLPTPDPSTSPTIPPVPTLPLPTVPSPTVPGTTLPPTPTVTVPPTTIPGGVPTDP